MRRHDSPDASRAPRRIRWRAALLAAGALAVAAAAGGLPAAASAAFPPELSTAGPLSAIDISNDLGCQLTASGDGASAFWGSSGYNDAGSCGTWLALTGATDGNGASGNPQIFGPTVPTGPTGAGANATIGQDFAPASQTMSGAGTSASPYVLTTVVNIPSAASGGSALGTITETDTYIVGQSTLGTVVTVNAAGGGAGLSGTLYHAGDCFLADNDDGYGAYVAATGSIQCTATPGNSPAAREMDFTPVTPGAHWVEGNEGAVWGAITSAGNPFPDTVATSQDFDNGMGLSWAVQIAAGGSAAYQFTTQVTPNVAPSSSASAGPCTENGVVPIATNEQNGPGQLNYVLDSGSQQSAPVTSDSQTTNVNVGTTAATHSLVYWAQDATGEQESPHHTLTVIVEPTGPTVAITSDQNSTSYEMGDTATISIAVSGVNLTTNPSAQHVPISTATPGTFMVTKTAVDACGTTNSTYTYTVLPPPVLGQNVNAGPVSGSVYIKLPGPTHGLLNAPLDSAVIAISKGAGFVPLTQARQIPVGSIVDTTAGVASLTSATSKKKQFNKGNFGAGVFMILQNRKQKGLTQLHLMNTVNVTKVCATAGKTTLQHAHIATSTKKLSSKVLSLLNGSAHGGFATVGRYSSATVQGTQWTVENRCDGTFTKVTRGEVVVTDFRTRKRITLTTGHSFLALPPILPASKPKPKG